MTLSLRNTLTRSVEPVEPLDPGRVGMYTCGPTVYRYAHVGNLRTYLLADLIRRALLYHGIEVLHVKNITDVGHLRDERFDRGEDRMLVRPGSSRRPPAEIADAYEAAFHADEALVNILPAHVFPRATEHIAEMLALAERLEDRGHAYATSDGNVYYAVSSFPGYGRLSGNTLDELRAGHRGEVEPDKRDPADFALWKAAGEGRLAQVADRALGRRLSRAGTSSARRWRCATSGRASTSTPAASTTSSPTTRTRSPSRRRSSAARRRASGSTASSC